MDSARSLHRRDAVADAQTQCADSSYTQDSCYPIALTKFVQGEDASFVWNPHLANFNKTNRVDLTIYAGTGGFDGSIGQENIILRYSNLTNPTSGAGLLNVKVNDSFWGDTGAIWAGNVSYPFFWTLWGSDQTDTFTVGRQPFFAAIQTALPDSILATMRSTQAAPSSSSAGTGSSTSSVTGSITAIPTGPTAAPSKSTSSSRTAIIAGVVSSLVGVILLLSLFFLLRRRRLAQRRAAAETHPDPDPIPILAPTPYTYEKSPLPLAPLRSPALSKSALDLEMRLAHQQLRELQYAHPELAASPTGATAASDSSENDELRRRIAMLTDEVERLRGMGAEAPPAYSMQDS
ncbi:hypothetical protein DFH09DRAFT_1327836 [Mycena vulgaris]|nr:hypothetical protein DFH09DRAFT_1327836 [Mycena vulgaris]